ncbi:hypothetical protein ACFPRD_07635 [Streptomyces kaempferi]
MNAETRVGCVDVVADLPADARAAEPVQASDGALDNAALGAEFGTVFRAASPDHRSHAESTDDTAFLSWS